MPVVLCGQGPEKSSVTAAAYFAKIPFPQNCPAVPLLPSEEEEQVISRLRNGTGSPAAACAAYSRLPAGDRRNRPSSTDARTIGSAFTTVPSFQRESEHTREWLNSQIEPCNKQLLLEFLKDVTIENLRRIGPQTNWSLLKELSQRSCEASLSDLRAGIDMERFWKVSRSEAYGRLPNKLKDYVAAHLLTTRYVFMAPRVEEIRVELRSNSVETSRGFYNDNVLLKTLAQGGLSAIETIFRVTGPNGRLFHQLNDLVKSDLIQLLFEYWQQPERDSRISLYSQLPVAIGEVGLFAMMKQTDGVALGFLRDLDIKQVSTSDRQIILYSLLEAGSMLDTQELVKRTKYFKGLFESGLFSKAGINTRTQLLQASRIPRIGSIESKGTFDFREGVTDLFNKASSLQDPYAYAISVAKFYQRLRIHWFLTAGSPASNLIPYFIFPTMAEGQYQLATLHLLFPDNRSAKILDEVRIQASKNRFGAGDALFLDYQEFPHQAYRASFGGAATRRVFVDEDKRFQTEDVHVSFQDGGQITLHIPVLQNATNDARPPKLEMVISALGLVPLPVRRQVGGIFVLPYPSYSKTRKGERQLAFYNLDRRTINFAQIEDDESWKNKFWPASTLFHEFGHLIFYQLLRMGELDSSLRAEYKRAMDADRADVSVYGRSNVDEDFAESLELIQLLAYIPSHDLDDAFKLLFPNRHAFILKYARDYLS
jgi:hypothetical protein